MFYSCGSSRIFAGMKVLFFFLVFFPGTSFAAPVFRLHLASEPTNLDPQLQKSATSSYLLQTLYRNIFVDDDTQGLVPVLGESCKRESPLVLVCKLVKNLRWSDGSPLTAADF